MNQAWLMFSQHAAQVVVAGLWQGCMATLLVAIGLSLLPRITAARRFAVWLATFALALILPFISHAKPLTETANASLQIAPVWGLVFTGLWLIAFVWRMGGLALQARRLRQIWLRAQPLQTSPEVAVLLANGPRKPDLYRSDDVAAPSVIGFLAPRLLLPSSMVSEVSESELQQIVLHECEHLRRRDDWLNLLQKVALAVFPLNVSLVWLDRRLSLERELACDAQVIAATGAPLDYAACLARLAEHRMGASRMALALSAWAQRSELARRVYTLLVPVRSVSLMNSRVATTGLACLLVVASGGMARVPQLVSFSTPALSASANPATFTVSRANDPVVPVMFHAAPPRPLSIVRVSSHHAPRSRATHKRYPGAWNAQRMYTTVAYPKPARQALVEVRFSYSYAAVPFGDGWLIVQL